jgi:hypothetical protein
LETVKHHVVRSGNNSLRGFFGSESVDFDPPSLSLRQNITKAKAKVVYDLASGFTPESDENAIRDLMKGSENSYELIRMVGVIGAVHSDTGWYGLDSELEYYQVDQVARQIAQVLDQRDYVVYQLIRRYLTLLDYKASPNLGDCFVRLLLWPKEFQAAEFDLLLTSRKAELLKGIASATMRGRDDMVNAARILQAVIDQYIAATPHRFTELIALMHEVNYTTIICSFLVKLDYQPLYRVVADMVDPGVPALQRIACFDTCLRLSTGLEFAAAAKAVEVVGSNEAKATVNRFMAALKAALDNFSPTLPAPTAVGAIVAALGAAGDTLSTLLTVIANLPDALSGAITISNIFGSDRDDKARELIGELATQGSLPKLAFTIKLEMVNWLLSSPGFLTIDITGDDEEIAIDNVMQAAKDHEQAELYQLAAGATWDSLDSNIQGAEFDELMNILNQPV